MSPKMMYARFAPCIIALCVFGCNQPPPTPVGTWTVRHEWKEKPADTELIDEPVVCGFSTTTITIKEDGTFFELLVVELFDDADPEPSEYDGTWQQDGSVVRFRRNGTDSTQSYVIDKQGLRMTGNVAGYDIVLTRQLED